MNSTISIIIPMYNSEKYISKCLDSVLAQVDIDVEIICVDDGSDDDTVQICNEYVKKHQNIVLYVQSHKGVSSARNTGIKNSRGDYIGFVDSDDWVEPNMYAELVKKMSRENAKIGVTNFCIVDSGGKKSNRKNEIPVADVINNHELLRFAFERERYRSITAWVWNKVFLRKFVLESNVLFDETLEIGEDVDFLVRLLMIPSKIIYIDNPLYNHTIQEDSLSRKFNSKKYNDRLLAYEKAISILHKNNVPNETIKWLKCFHCYHASNFLEKALLYDKKSIVIDAKKKVKMYRCDYEEINKDKLERIERIYQLMRSEI